MPNSTTGCHFGRRSAVGRTLLSLTGRITHVEPNAEAARRRLNALNQQRISSRARMFHSGLVAILPELFLLAARQPPPPLPLPAFFSSVEVQRRYPVPNTVV